MSSPACTRPSSGQPNPPYGSRRRVRRDSAESREIEMNIFARLEPGFAEIFAEIPKPTDTTRAREATPLTIFKPRPIPEGRDDFTRDADSSGA